MDISQINAYNNLTAQTAETTVGTKDSISTTDFFKLLAAQIANQDVLNPSQDTEFMSQMAQFSALQSMQEVSAYSKLQLQAIDSLSQLTYIQFGSGLVGKTVLVATADANGKYAEHEGVVDKVSFADGVPTIFVDGKEYGLEALMEVRAAAETPETEQPVEQA